MKYTKQIATLLMTVIFIVFEAGCIDSNKPESAGTTAGIETSGATGITSMTETIPGGKDENGNPLAHRAPLQLLQT